MITLYSKNNIDQLDKQVQSLLEELNNNSNSDSRSKIIEELETLVRIRFDYVNSLN